MKWIGQHIYDLVARFRNDVIIENNSDDYATFTVADTGDLTIATVGDGTTDSDLILDADGRIDFQHADGRAVNVTSTETSAANTGGSLNLVSNDGAALGDDHRLGKLAFQAAEDGSSTLRQGASIQAFADAAWSGSENGTRLEFYTMDGDASSELSLTLDSDKLATFAGAVTVTGALTGTLATATQPAIESIGTDGDTLTILGDITQFSNVTANKPEIRVLNMTDDATGPVISFWKQRYDSGAQVGEDDDVIGNINFISYNAAGTPINQDYAKIYTDIHDATDGEESGRLTLQVANHDGGLGSGLILTGGSVNNEVDANIGYGTSSQTLVAGTLNVGGNNLNLEASASLTIDDTNIISDSSGTATLSNIDAIDATTEATIEAAIDTLPALTSIGTAANTLVVTNDQVNFESANSTDPLVIIKNTTDDEFGGRLRFLNARGADGQDNDEAGIIEFYSYDDGTPAGEQYARIKATIHDATATEESGKLELQVASHDGGDETGLTLTGGSVDAEVDVTLGLGANSVVTVPGNIDLAGDIDVDGTLETDALTVGGTNVLTGSLITTLGTISSGTWQGNRIASAYLDNDTAHLSGSQTFTGTKTLNSFKGTAGATVTNILDEDAMGSNSATALATQQSIKAYVDGQAKYANSIISFTGQATMLSSGNWVMPGKGGVSNHTWNKDIGINHETNGGDPAAAIPKQWAHAGVRVPFACIVDGMSCMINNHGGNRQATVGLFFARAADGTTAVDWGSGDDTEPILQIHADANNESGSYTQRPAHAEVVESEIAMAAGDVFYPAIKLTGVTSGGNTDNVYATFNVHIKTLLI